MDATSDTPTTTLNATRYGATAHVRTDMNIWAIIPNLGFTTFLTYLARLQHKYVTKAMKSIQRIMTKSNDIVTYLTGRLDRRIEKRLERLEKLVEAKHGQQVVLINMLVDKAKEFEKSKERLNKVLHENTRLRRKSRASVTHNWALRRQIKLVKNIARWKVNDVERDHDALLRLLANVEETVGGVENECDILRQERDVAQKQSRKKIEENEVLRKELDKAEDDKLQMQRELDETKIKQTNRNDQGSHAKAAMSNPTIEYQITTECHLHDKSAHRSPSPGPSDSDSSASTIPSDTSHHSLIDQFDLLLTILNTINIDDNHCQVRIIYDDDIERLGPRLKTILTGLLTRLHYSVTVLLSKKDEEDVAYLEMKDEQTATTLHERESEVARLKRERRALRSNQQAAKDSLEQLLAKIATVDASQSDWNEEVRQLSGFARALVEDTMDPRASPDMMPIDSGRATPEAQEVRIEKAKLKKRINELYTENARLKRDIRGPTEERRCSSLPSSRVTICY